MAWEPTSSYDTPPFSKAFAGISVMQSYDLMQLSPGLQRLRIGISGVHQLRLKSEHNLTHGVFESRFKTSIEADRSPIGFARTHRADTAIDANAMSAR